MRERAIPKPKGSGKVRTLGIPTIADRVVQAAGKLVLEPIFEADFLPVSYGFRPGRRAQDAIAEIHTFGSRGYRWVLGSDIEACFDRIDHAALMDRVRPARRVLLLDQLRALGHAGSGHRRVDASHIRALTGGGDGPLARRSGSGRLQAPPDHRGRWHPPGRRADRRQPVRGTQLIPLVKAIPKVRGRRGRPRYLYGDRGYDYDHHRAALRRLGITPRIARKNTPTRLRLGDSPMGRGADLRLAAPGQASTHPP
ncbi:reverse transcriptase domain-containing protein [Carbonactinospora thermoautotrophica]|uniref:reverse transcriptase domain-containing protein n=1 Tax=Carbonactinospora thermoautotrophica TaxID=1469144 RepID=UPI003556992B